MRGDGSSGVPNRAIAAGSPPHARGRQVVIGESATVGGITPACAGTAMSMVVFEYTFRDHPRMRGDGTLMCLASG